MRAARGPHSLPRMRHTRSSGTASGMVVITLLSLIAVSSATAAAFQQPSPLLAAASHNSTNWVFMPLRWHPDNQEQHHGRGRAGAAAAAAGGGGAARRALLRDHLDDVRGSVNGGYYSATLQVGTPPRPFDVVLDTGSSTSFVRCAKCRACGTHTTAGYDPLASKTAQPVACASAACAGSGGRFKCDARGAKCMFAEKYKEGSSADGWLVKDAVQFPGSMPAPADVILGCAESETGSIFTQRADGILGLARSPTSFIGQAAAAGKLSRKFSLCFGFPAGGAVWLGDAPLPPGVAPPAWTPLAAAAVRNNYYAVRLLGVDAADSAQSAVGAVGAAAAAAAAPRSARGAASAGAQAGLVFRELPVDPTVFGWGYGTVLDSGSNMNYFATPLYEAIVARVTAALKAQGKDALYWAGGPYNDHCWLLAPDGDQARGWAAAAALFPVLRLRFDGGASLLLPPKRYLFVAPGGDFCLAVFDNGRGGSVVGTVAVRDALVVYDAEAGRIGFADADCDALSPAGAAPLLPTGGSSGVRGREGRRRRRR